MKVFKKKVSALYRYIRNFFYRRIYFTSKIPAEWTVNLLKDKNSITAAMRRLSLYHPVMDFNFNHIISECLQYFAYHIYSAEKEYFLPFIFSDNRNILLLTNYLQIPEAVIKTVLRNILDTFRAADIATQRSYNNYCIRGLKKEKLASYEIEADGSFEEYLQKLKKKARFNYRYYKKKLLEDYPDFEIKYFDLGETPFELFEIFTSLVKQKYPVDYWHRFLQPEIYTNFTQHIITVAVFINGKPAAFNIYYRQDNVLIFIGNTCDQYYDRYSLGYVTTVMAIKHGFSLKIKKIILGPGDYGYKGRLANQIQDVFVYSV